MQSPKYRNRTQASHYLEDEWCLKRSPNYLAKLAVVGGGPAFRKANRTPIYTDEDLNAYAEDVIGPRVHSTSELKLNNSRKPKSGHTIPSGKLPLRRVRKNQKGEQK